MAACVIAYAPNFPFLYICKCTAAKAYTISIDSVVQNFPDCVTKVLVDFHAFTGCYNVGCVKEKEKGGIWPYEFLIIDLSLHL